VKTFIAYAVVALGIPGWIGHPLGTILSIPISLLVGVFRSGNKTPQEIAEVSAKDKNAWLHGSLSDMAIGDVIAHGALDILSGVAASFLAGLLFYLLSVHLNVFVLLILIVWEIVPILPALARRMLVLRVAGVLGGWLLTRWLF
jgi:hypothetical protein